MKIVEPIRDIEKINDIKKYFSAKENYRDLLLFVLWINSALRISDLLNLKVKDFLENWKIKKYTTIKEIKTGKTRKVFINENITLIFKKFIFKYPKIVMNNENYLFFVKNWQNHYTSRWASKILKKVAKQVWIEENIASHSLRKTWGYQARKKWINISIIQHNLNHSSLRETFLYLWITSDEIQNACEIINL